MLEGDARLLLARAPSHGGQPRERAARGRGGHPDLRAATARRSAGSPRAARSRPRPPGRPASPTTMGRWIESGPAARPRDRRHRQPAPTALARRDARQPRGRVRPGQRVPRRGGARSAPSARDAEREPQIPVGGRLVVAQANPVSAIEPVATKIIEESEIGANVYETLLTTDASGHLVPWLCEKWDLVDQRARGVVLTLRARRPLLRRHAAHRRRRQAVDRGVDSRGADDAARRVRRDPRRRPSSAAGDAADVAGIVARSEHETASCSLAERAADLPGAAHRGQHGDRRPARRRASRRRRLSAPGRSARVARARPRRRRAQPDVLAERAPASRRDRVPAVAQPRRRSRRQFRAGELDVARDLAAARTSKTSCATRGSGRGSSRRRRRTRYFVLFNCRTGPHARATWRCAARSRASVPAARPGLAHARAASRRRPPGLIPPGMLGHDPGRRWPALSRERGARDARGPPASRPRSRLTATVQPLLRDRVGSAADAVCSTPGRTSASRCRPSTMDMTSFLTLWRDNDGDRSADRPLERRLRRPGQLHPRAVPLGERRAAQRTSRRRRSDRLARRGPRREPARRSARRSTAGSRDCCSSRRRSSRCSTTSTTAWPVRACAAWCCAAPSRTSTTASWAWRRRPSRSSRRGAPAAASSTSRWPARSPRSIPCSASSPRAREVAAGRLRDAHARQGRGAASCRGSPAASRSRTAACATGSGCATT